jgi:hypothetical protein
VFCGAAPGNIENRGHTSDYYERMRIKTEHLPRAYLKKGLAGKEKQPPSVGGREKVRRERMPQPATTATAKRGSPWRSPAFVSTTTRQLDRHYRDHNLD